ncbi:MAG: SpvB/TcaC N-terminal domain-containing protein, partial [Pseudomonadota bacterium]
MSIPIAASTGRSGFTPQLSLAYDSGSGNGAFGLGWSLAVPAIARKTEKGLPRYWDSQDSDEFVLSGSEDLVPVLVQSDDDWIREQLPPRTLHGLTYSVRRFRPRIEGLFSRIEYWKNTNDPADSFWRSISRDNITTWYGKTPESRIADPSDPSRIFSWLICESSDDKGNVVAYEFKPEDSVNVDVAQSYESNRTDNSRSANRYLKHIRYGNRTPYFPELGETGLATPLPSDWLFQVTLDYGEHHPDNPTPNDNGDWQERHDPFSSCRAGFEIRTYRLCQRILMFHHFSDEDGVGSDCLVRSTDLAYRHQQDPGDARNPVHSVLLSVTQCGYKRQAAGGYRKRRLPPLDFEYSEAQIHENILDVDAGSLENLPEGLDGADYQWVDLDGEGLSGILSQQGSGWFYKRNLSPANLDMDDTGQTFANVRLAPLEQMSSLPSLAAFDRGGQQLLDLAGDGRLDLVEFDGPTPGFFERRFDAGWNSFTPFSSLPVIDWSDPNLRFVDLTGDGHADILITEHEVLCWHPSQRESGFGPRQTVRQALNEVQGPRLLLADGTQSIHLADISGDGLTDIVRVRNGGVCYWPNLGYGRFGARVTMDNAPVFDAEDQFGQQRIRLADVDGSGATDIVYLRGDEVAIYYNHSGNGWSDASLLTHFPATDNMSSVQVVDLLGNGTACLVWSSPLHGDARRSLRYIDLMGGTKPHLMIGTRNNLGAETRVHYAPSTKFYVQDRLDGNPWITRIPFVVHVVERIETFDHVSRNRFVTRYAYHHGHFDGVEREFRGFGMVEQFDTEEFAALSNSMEFPVGDNIAESSHVPPVYTRTWFHTGVYLGRQRVSNFFAGLLDSRHTGEYYREPVLTDEEAARLLLPDTILPDGLTVEEQREACRALKGSMLRQEVYASDGTDEEPHPYTVTEQNFTVKMLQPEAGNRHAVFFTHSREVLSYQYERVHAPADPRLTHALTLAVDDFGNELASAAVGYGRREPDPDLAAHDQTRQAALHISCSETAFTNAIEADDVHLAPLPHQAASFEMTGLELDADNSRLAFEDVHDAVQSTAPIAYHEAPAANVIQKRLLELSRTLYRRNDLEGPLPAGALESLALPFESYQLAFTPEHLTLVLGDRIDDALLSDEGHYVHFDEDDANWWIPSGQVFMSPDEADDATQELIFARQHFFLPVRFRDPFGQTTAILYDAYDLLLLETRDPLDNRVTAGERNDDDSISPRLDYRTLQPELVTDPNGNRATVAFDTLGLITGTAVGGKRSQDLGDSLDGFEADLDQDQIDGFFANPRGPPAAALLGDATTRIIYDVTRFQRMGDAAPGFAATLARETHVSDLAGGEETQIQVGLAYSDGFGRVIQNKTQAEPGPVVEGGPDIDPRWVGSGWTIFNNKGEPVRQYEPFFSASPDFEFAHIEGVSPTIFYDPTGRVIATLHPNRTWEKVVFDPWRQVSYDVNDTVLMNSAADPDVGHLFSRLPEAEYLPSWHDLRINPAHAAEALALWPDAERRQDEVSAAVKASAHADTPGVSHLDAMGRPFLSLADNGAGNLFETRTEQDIEGATLRVIDARGNEVMKYLVAVEGQPEDVIGYDVAGRQLYELGMDGGERRVMKDVGGSPIRAWDSRGHMLRTRYDELRRPTHLFVQDGDAEEFLAERAVYGEAHSESDRNLRGQVYRQYDTAGVVTNDRFDFKGNPAESVRRLAGDYRQVVNWSALSALEDIAAIEAAADALLEGREYATATRYDGLNRPVSITTPDGSSTLPAYNDANLLESMHVRLRGDSQQTPFVSDINYNAKGQRQAITYATRDSTNFTTVYEYDPDTFRLTRMATARHRDAAALQDMRYAYDPAGNITSIRDNAHQPVFFNNSLVEPHCAYVYDALYRLTRAEGREHASQNNTQRDASDFAPVIGIPFPNSPQALQRYTEEYLYDAVGNILSFTHTGGAVLRWKRCYQYALDSNRLLGTSGAGEFQGQPCPEHYVAGPGSTLSQPYEYDAHGNMVRMPHLPT